MKTRKLKFRTKGRILKIPVESSLKEIVILGIELIQENRKKCVIQYSQFDSIKIQTSNFTFHRDEANAH
jgi:hypothetical protein